VTTCVFTRRLVVFHETFAPLGSKSKERPVVSALWHEALSGRNAEDLASAYVKVIRSDHLRDIKNVVFYVDNCGAQNKNWTLFTALISLVNSAGGPQTVTLRYLEKGHTFMSADSYHASVESAMRKMKNVYDFSDFVSAVERYGAKVIKMTTGDFVMWQSCMSMAKFTKKPSLSDVLQEVQFRKGSTQLYWKVSMNDADYEAGEFLKKREAAKILSGIQLYQSLQTPRGITDKKKNDLVKNLCPLMPDSRHRFWSSLAVNDDSTDLIDCQ